MYNVKKIILCSFIYLASCASLNPGDSDFRGEVVAVNNESPVPVEIARQIQNIVEGGSVVKVDDFLKFDKNTQLKAQNCIESNDCFLRLKHQLSEDIITKEQVVSANSQNSSRKPASVSAVNKSILGPNRGVLSRGRSLGPLKKERLTDMTGGSTVTYIVKRGDTLMEIAFDKYADYLRWRKIYSENREKIVKPELMQIGTQLDINNFSPVDINRSGKAYKIKKSDTLKSISKQLYGDENQWKKLWKNNPQLIKNPKKIYHGFTLYYNEQSDISDGLRQPANDEKSKD